MCARLGERRGGKEIFLNCSIEEDAVVEFDLGVKSFNSTFEFRILQ